MSENAQNCINQDPQINTVILKTIKEHILYFFISLLIFVVSSFAVIYTYLHFWEVVRGIVSVIDSVLSFILTTVGGILYYYSLYGLRYLSVLTSGVGTDITMNMCKSDNWPYMNTKYIDAFHLSGSKSKTYYEDPRYYAFCVSHPLTAFVTFLYAHLFIGFCVLVITVFASSCEIGFYTTYKEMVRKSNEGSTGYRPVGKTLTPFDGKEFVMISVTCLTVVYLFLSGTNYFIRRFYVDDIYYVNFPILLTFLFISKMCVPLLALKMTRFTEITEIELTV
jgi:hypothetical protein